MTDINRALQLERMREVQRARIAQLELEAHKRKVAECLANWAKLTNAKIGARIDSENTRASVRTEVATTAQVQLSRITLHDAARTNPILRKILIAAQKGGTM